MAKSKIPALTPAFGGVRFLWDFVIALRAHMKANAADAPFIKAQLKILKAQEEAQAHRDAPTGPPTPGAHKPSRSTSPAVTQSVNTTPAMPSLPQPPAPTVTKSLRPPIMAQVPIQQSVASTQRDVSGPAARTTSQGAEPASDRGPLLSAIEGVGEDDRTDSHAEDEVVPPERLSSVKSKPRNGKPEIEQDATPAAQDAPAQDSPLEVPANTRKGPIQSLFAYPHGCDACMHLKIDCWVQAHASATSCYKCSLHHRRCFWLAADKIPGSKEKRAELQRQAWDLENDSADEADDEQQKKSKKRKLAHTSRSREERGKKQAQASVDVRLPAPAPALMAHPTPKPVKHYREIKSAQTVEDDESDTEAPPASVRAPAAAKAPAGAPKSSLPGPSKPRPAPTPKPPVAGPSKPQAKPPVTSSSKTKTFAPSEPPSGSDYKRTARVASTQKGKTKQQHCKFPAFFQCHMFI